MKEEISISETSVCFYKTTRCNIREGCHFNARRRENLKSQRLKYIRVASENFRNRGRSVSIVHDYTLDDQGSIPGRGKGFLL
jgi:hypothetical protein